MPIVTTLADLSVALGARGLRASRSYLSRLSRKPWWPKGELRLDVDAAEAAIRQNVAGHYDGTGGGTGARSPMTAPVQSAPSRAPALDVATSHADVPSDRAAVVVEAAMARLAQSVADGGIGPRDIADAQKALSEWRISLKSCCEEAERLGQLVPVDIVRATTADVARVCVEAFDALVMQLPGRVEEWHADPAWIEAPAARRAEIVRAWAERRVEEDRKSVV